MVYLTWYIEGGGQDMIQELFADYNVMGLSVMTIGRAEMFGYSNTPLDSMDDFEGQVAHPYLPS